MRSTSLSFLGFLTFAIAAACGGASNTELLGGGGHSSSSSGSSSGSSSTSGSGSGSGSSSGSTSSSSGSGSSSGGVPDASMEDVTSVDVVVPMETGPTGPAVLCPMNGQPATCNAGDYCCVTNDQTTGTQTDSCEHQGQACTGGTIVRCAATADCPANQVCCGLNTGMMYTEVACRQSCNGTGQITFCDPAAMDCPTAAPTCQQSTLLPGFNVCQ